MTEILFSEKHLERACATAASTRNAEKTVPIPEPHSGKPCMLCRVVRVKNSERQSCKGCKQGGTVGKRSPLRDTGVSAFLLLCSNRKLKMES